MLQGFFYNYGQEMPAAQSNLRLSKIGSCDEGVDVHHMRIITPFIVSNRSMFVSWYHLHSREENGAYIFVASQAGNDNFAREQINKIGSDVQGDYNINYVRVTPIFNGSNEVTGCKIAQVLSVDP